jgi:hypothetical protein
MVLPFSTKELLLKFHTVKEDHVVIVEMIEEVIDMDHHNVQITEFLLKTYPQVLAGRI